MNVKIPFRAPLIALSVVAVIFASIPVFGSAVGGGNICNEGCALDAKCGGDTPYLCQKSWGLDTCVAKGFDGGYCGGKTDKGGYCFECSGGCVAQSELLGGEKCGLFTTCGPDEYCCRRAEWYTSNTCKPKHSDMGCCGGPPTGGDRTTYLKINIGNNKPAACTDKAKWEVKAKGVSDFVDYSPECVEGSPDVKIENGASMALTCTSQKLPTAATGPHTARASWCGESTEFKYGLGAASPLQIDVLWVRADSIRDITAPPYETEDPTPTIAIKTSNNALCGISLNNEKYDGMTKACTKKAGLETEFYCISPDVGAPGDKKVFVACKDAVGSESSKEIDFMRKPDMSGPIIDIDVPSYLYDKPILVKFSFKDPNGLDAGSIKAYVINKDGDKVADLSPLVFEAYDEFEDKYVYSYDLKLGGYPPGKYGIMAQAKDDLGHLGQLGVPKNFQILKSSDKFKIYAIAVNYGDMDAYRQNAQKELQKFETVSPFREPGCKNQLDITILDKNCLIEACTQFKTRSSCASGLVTCVETMGISDYDVIMAFGDYKKCGGFTFPGSYPVAVCDSCDAKSGRGLQCAAHELGHMFKLCEEYSKSDWIRQNEDFPSFRLLAESPPYAGCGNSYPENTGIGPMGFSPLNSCNTDCSIDAKACETGTCGIKLGGTSPPYDTGIMGGGLPGTNPAGYGSEGYQSILKSLEGMGYCG